jgi:hypothetical protein
MLKSKWLIAILITSSIPETARASGQWILIEKPGPKPQGIEANAIKMTSREKNKISSLANTTMNQEKKGSVLETQTKQQEGRKWIIGIGGGTRIGLGEPTYPEIYSRAGYLVTKNLSVSIRPRYIFGNIDGNSNQNSQGAFQMPATIDIKPNGRISPYAGVGLALNTDSSRHIDAMIIGGIDVRMTKRLSADASIKYIFQSELIDNNNRDIEASAVVYYRF